MGNDVLYSNELKLKVQVTSKLFNFSFIAMTVDDCSLNIDAKPGVKGQKSDSQRIRSRLNDPSMRSQLISGPSEFKEGVIFEN